MKPAFSFQVKHKAEFLEKPFAETFILQFPWIGWGVGAVISLKCIIFIHVSSGLLTEQHRISS